jgi:hypothetical protein
MPDTLTVDGFVYYADGKTPMKGVKVLVVYANDTLATPVFTNGEGHYALTFSKSEKPIVIRYIPQQPIDFPPLENLSGSTSHTISRTQEGNTGTYSARRLRQMSNSAQTASTLKLSNADRHEMDEYYRTLLADVRVEQATVTNQTMLLSLQTEFNEARRQYGLPPVESLKNEAGQPLTLAYLQDWPNRGRQQANSCMTGDVLKELLRRVCNEEPPSISGLTRAEVRDLRQKLGCKSNLLDILNDDPIPKSKPSPKPFESPVRHKP